MHTKHVSIISDCHDRASRLNQFLRDAGVDREDSVDLEVVIWKPDAQFDYVKQKGKIVIGVFEHTSVPAPVLAQCSTVLFEPLTFKKVQLKVSFLTVFGSVPEFKRSDSSGNEVQFLKSAQTRLRKSIGSTVSDIRKRIDDAKSEPQSEREAELIDMIEQGINGVDMTIGSAEFLKGIEPDHHEW